MRIISGTARGARLRSAPIEDLRPMLDRVKESLFNIVRELLPGARVLDLFGGTGALGLEALSRGAAGCVFVEQDRRLADLVWQNARACKLADLCEVLVADVLALPRQRPPGAAAPAGLAFVDPPYVLVDDPNRRADLFRALEDLVGGWIAPGALLVLHHRPLAHAVWPTTRLAETDKRVYGRSQLTFLEVRGDETDDPA